MRASTAYFAGAGTVIVAIVGGLGGGLLIADIVSPKSPNQEMTRLERRMSSEPIQATAPSEPVQYLPSSQLSVPGTAAPVSPPQAQAQAPTQPQPATAGPTPAQPAETAAAPPPAASPPQPAAQPAADQRATVPTEAKTESKTEAKARDAEAKRAADKRKAERRQQWAEKRRYQQRQEQELLAVEETVRTETEPRRFFAGEPVRIETPQIRLFDFD
jgi:type IV secretory pathway VirB10-like protein